MSVYNLDNREWERAVPFYRRLAHPVPARVNTRVEEKRNRKLPPNLTLNYRHFITLCTLGSVHLAFTNPPNGPPQRYDHIFIDEKSLVSDLDFVHLCRLHVRCDKRLALMTTFRESPWPGILCNSRHASGAARRFSVLWLNVPSSNGLLLGQLQLTLVRIPFGQFVSTTNSGCTRIYLHLPTTSAVVQ